jgi:hypothetical protein
MSPDKRCPRGGDHVWAGVGLIGKVQCLACNKVVTFEEMVELEGMGKTLLIPEPTKQQSPKRGNFWRGNVQAKKVLIFTSFDPATDQSEADIYDEQQDYRVNKVSVGWSVDAVLEKMFAVMEKGDNLAITVEVVEDE